MKEILSLANDFVSGVEEKHLDKLRSDADKGTEKAEGCSCASCRKGAEKKWDEYYDEYFRVNRSGVDHEEDFIAGKALSKLRPEAMRQNAIDDTRDLLAMFNGWDGTGDSGSFLDEAMPYWKSQGQWDDKEWVEDLLDWLINTLDDPPEDEWLDPYDDRE